jgi:O-antigen ligase
MQSSILPYVVIIPAFMLVCIGVIGFLVQVKEKLFITALGLLLLIYMTTGKGFAYLGVPPLYISEMVFVLGIVTVLFLVLVRGRFYVGAINHWGAFCLLLFIIWCALRTVPFLTEYRIEALRDGVIWGYALIAFCVALLLTPSGFDRLLTLYSRLLPYILVWLTVAYLLTRYISLPSVPGSPVEIINLKSGDAGAHLAGAGAFLLMRLDRIYGRPYKKWQLWMMWAFWGISWLLYGTVGRGGMLAALLGLAIAFLLRPKLSGWVRPAVLVSVLLFALLLADLTGISQVGSRSRRAFSFEQIATNFASLVGQASSTDEQGTIQWRLMWWKKIADYTILGGPYFWDGKGFGINLATADGFPSPAGAPPNRHPHNITMNILGRTGVPGLFLWLLFLLVFGLRLLKATTRQRYAGKIATWLLAYWVALLFNAQVDVFLENPMGGIWFWSVVGISWVFIYRLPRAHAQTLPVLAPDYLPLPNNPSQATR